MWTGVPVLNVKMYDIVESVRIGTVMSKYILHFTLVSVATGGYYFP